MTTIYRTQGYPYDAALARRLGEDRAARRARRRRARAQTPRTPRRPTRR
ncbi:MAG TPA: hypothetical protein VH479_08360 [Acidimicrobiales bacterium]|jgi:hypothetical protein